MTAVCGGEVDTDVASEMQSRPLLPQAGDEADSYVIDIGDSAPLSPVTLSMYQRLQATHDEYAVTCLPPSYRRVPVAPPPVVRPKAVSMKQAKEVHDLLQRGDCDPLPVAPTAQKQKYHRELMGKVLADPYHTQSQVEEVESLIRRDVLSPFS